jgi:hypothetical protein
MKELIMDILFDAQLESSVEPPVFSLMFDPEAMSLHCIGDMTTIMVQAHVFIVQLAATFYSNWVPCKRDIAIMPQGGEGRPHLV